MNESERAEAVALWESGEVTLEDLAHRFKKSTSTFKKLFDRVGAVKGSKAAATRKKVEEKVEESIAQGADVLANRIADTKEEVFKMSSGLRKLMWMHISKARQENRSIASVINEIKTLKEAAALLKITREESYVVLGLDKDNDGEQEELPELVFHQLADDDIRNLIAQQTDPDAIDGELDAIDGMISEAERDEDESGEG